MKFAIVTGVSKGLGESVAKLFLELGINVIGISRSGNGDLPKIARENNRIYKHYFCDLADTSAVEETIQQMMELLFAQEPSMIYLVNNAAVLEPIDQAMNIKNKDLTSHVQVNMIAPMILMNSLLQKSVNMEVPLIGVTVTTGVANRPVYGWSAYCSTKASINMYTKTVALEQDELKTGNKVIAFNPGIMDTEMQVKIRESNHDAFKDVETFINYKKNNLLKDTRAVGRVLVDILADEVNIENGTIYNVSDYF